MEIYEIMYVGNDGINREEKLTVKELGDVMKHVTFLEERGCHSIIVFDEHGEVIYSC